MSIAMCRTRRAEGHAAKRSGPVWYRLRTREWDFFVSNEAEAFAVLSRHDVDEVDVMTGR